MTRRHLRIYVAGAIQGETLLHSLRNFDEGQSWTAKVFQLGFSPFPVFSDYAFIQKVRPVPNIREVYAYSLAWLRVADAMFVTPGWERSTGCKQEIAECERLAIPVFHDLHELSAWADGKTSVPNIDEILARGDD